MRHPVAIALAASTMLFLAAQGRRTRRVSARRSRDDLVRFYGIYGDPDDANLLHFFVAPAVPPDADIQLPEGHLMIGPMWADVAPWYMRSVADTRFEQGWVQPGAEPVVGTASNGDRAGKE